MEIESCPDQTGIMVEKMIAMQVFEHRRSPDAKPLQFLLDGGMTAKFISLAEHMDSLFFISGEEEDPSVIKIADRIDRFTMECFKGETERLLELMPRAGQAVGEVRTYLRAPLQQYGFLEVVKGNLEQTVLKSLQSPGRKPTGVFRHDTAPSLSARLGFMRRAVRNTGYEHADRTILINSAYFVN
jgi:hypothetical protein